MIFNNTSTLFFELMFQHYYFDTVLAFVVMHALFLWFDRFFIFSHAFHVAEEFIYLYIELIIVNE